MVAKDNKPKETEATIEKSRARVSFEEFNLTSGLRPEFSAGFKAWLKEDLFHFDEEWEELLTQYKNRKL